MKNSVYDNGGFIGRVADYTDSDYYTQTVTATDPHLSNVTLLIKFEGTDGGTTFTDSSPNNCTITGNNATTSTAVSKFGASSGYFGGSTSAYVYVSSADSGVSDFGTGDFTVEMFVYRTTSLGDKYFTNRQNVLSGPFLIMNTPTSGNTLNINIGGTSYITTNTIPTNQWSHIAVTRESGTVRAFIDGVLGVTGTNNTVSITDGTNGNHPPIIGGMGYAWGGATGNNHDGYIDELRVTKGVARYTANFTPPTASYGQAVVNANKKNTGIWSMDADYLNAEITDTSLDIDAVYGTTYLREITSFPTQFSSGSGGGGQVDVTWIFDMTFSTTDTGCILDQGGGTDGLYLGMVSGGNLRLAVSGAVSGVSNQTSTTTTDMSAYAGVAGQLIVTIDYQNHIQCWWNNSTSGINQIVSVDFNGDGDWSGTNVAKVGEGSSAVHDGQSVSAFTGTLTRYREITAYVDTSTF